MNADNSSVRPTAQRPARRIDLEFEYFKNSVYTTLSALCGIFVAAAVNFGLLAHCLSALWAHYLRAACIEHMLSSPVIVTVHFH